MTKEESNKVVEFLYDRKNVHNCTQCPYNDGFDGKLPCGQQHCWVSVHTQEES